MPVNSRSSWKENPDASDNKAVKTRAQIATKSTFFKKELRLDLWIVLKLYVSR